MSVYVDPLTTGAVPKAFRWTSRSCRLYADTLEELHAMARAIGMRREWLQTADGLPHYDLVPARRAMAVERGAIEHSREQAAQFVRSRMGVEQQQGLFGGQ